MLLGLLGVVLSDVTALVYARCSYTCLICSYEDLFSGITCTPITIVGVGSTACNQQTVCCQNNTFVSVHLAARPCADEYFIERPHCHWLRAHQHFPLSLSYLRFLLNLSLKGVFYDGISLVEVVE